MMIQETVAVALVLLGAIFMFAGSVGIVRLPDFFSRTHAAGKTDTLGIMLSLAGLAVYEGWSLNSLKLLVVILFVAIVNPVSVHALAKAAMEYGIKPWFRPKTGETEAKEK
jgi:multicomponent Na+:H+ antiporter subunit G